MARPRSEDKRQAILLAATRLFAEEGLGAPTARIAKDASVAIGSLFTYFPTKEDLENQLYLYLKEQLRNALAPIPDSQDLREQIRQAWNTYIRWGLDHPLEHFALSKLAMSPAVTDEARAHGREAFCEVSRLLEKAKGTGALRDQPIEFVEAMMGSMAETTLQFISQTSGNGEELLDAGFRGFWSALTVEPDFKGDRP